MRFVSLLLCAWLFSAGPLAAEDSDRDVIPVIAKSGRIELRSLQITRVIMTGGIRGELRPHLQISLLIAPRPPLAVLPPIPIELPAPDNVPIARRVEPLLVRFADLAPIEDDTGHLLSTKERLAEMPICNEDMEVGNAFPADENMSFSVGLKLDSPARAATKIKLLKGKLVVSKKRIAALGFKDLAALDGRPLDHPKLKDFTIRATLKTEGERTRITLRLPEQNSRVLHWGLAKDGQMLHLEPQFSQPVQIRRPFDRRLDPVDVARPVEQVKDYPKDLAKDAILGIAFSEPVEWQVFPFEFKDLELP